MRKKFLAVLAFGSMTAATLAAQDRRDEQFYYPGAFNWQFLRTYPEAARLFNAFDYGHAVLYERLYTLPDSARAAAALEKEYRFLATDLLVRPPRFAVVEEVIEPSYAKLAWKAKLMFDWAHVLHRQIYDVYADDRIPDSRKDALIERLTDYYLSRRDIAYVPVPKSMALMDEQYYSQVFRLHYPKFNGLIWAYHWLQVGLYEPFIAGRTPDEKKAGVQAAVARFWTMLDDPPATMPRVMPMTATVAPLFTARHPRAAAIFDNLHMTHDIISDILAADTVPRDRKREVIYAVLAEFRDTTRNVMTRDEWLMMGEHMGGIDAMGGPVLGLIRSTSPAATGAARAMDHGGMRMALVDTGMARPDSGMARGDTSMSGMRVPTPKPDSGLDAATAARVRALIADTARLRAVVADSAATRRLIVQIRRLTEPERSRALAAVRAAQERPKRPQHEGHRP